jgi:3-deoxy-D-manno-octulosonic acid kinase
MLETIASGRGSSCIVQLDHGRAILRQYHRGGLVGNLLSNQYLWMGKKMSRPWREWHVLLRAQQAGLPVPQPIAACACRSGFWYRAALMTAYLDDTEMLTVRLRRESLAADGWHRLGALIRQMHEAGIRHADLTTDNILIDSKNRFYLVDFDKARMMKRLGDWQWRPLLRLQRSMEKRDSIQKLHYNADDWQTMMDSYQS